MSLGGPSPVSRLVKDVEKLASQKQPTAEIKYGPGEIGRLASEFSRVLTRLVETQQKFEEQSWQYSHILQNIGEGIIATKFSEVDGEAVLTYANPAAEELFGVKPGSLVGAKIKHFTPEHQKGIAVEQEDLRRKGITSTYEIQIQQPNGGLRRMLAPMS